MEGLCWARDTRGEDVPRRRDASYIHTVLSHMCTGGVGAEEGEEGQGLAQRPRQHQHVREAWRAPWHTHLVDHRDGGGGGGIEEADEEGAPPAHAARRWFNTGSVCLSDKRLSRLRAALPLPLLLCIPFPHM